MAYEQQVLDLPLKGGGAITKYYFTKVSAADEVEVCSGATDRVLGVCQETVAADGDSADIRVLGVTKVVAGAAVAAGALVGTDANGKAVTKSTAGDFVAGTALEAAGADGDIISVLLTPNCVLHA